MVFVVLLEYLMSIVWTLFVFLLGNIAGYYMEFDGYTWMCFQFQRIQPWFTTFVEPRIRNLIQYLKTSANIK